MEMYVSYESEKSTKITYRAFVNSWKENGRTLLLLKYDFPRNNSGKTKNVELKNQILYSSTFPDFGTGFHRKSYLTRKKFALIFVSSRLGRAFGDDTQMMTSRLTILFESVQFVKLILQRHLTMKNA